MKIVTLGVKPEVGNGLEFKILLFPNAGIGARDKNKSFQRRVEEQSAFGTYGDF